MAPKPHLIGAYAMFWDRAKVNWHPGQGPAAWQLLGRINKNKPKVRVCDFRTAKGFYVLFDEFGATYVGLAGGPGGIGARLQLHVKDPRKNWTRFCFFCFDDVVDAEQEGWSVLERRDALRSTSSEVILRECEALLITILGSSHQNDMHFQEGRRWHQLLESDFLPGGSGLKVDVDLFSDPRFRRLGAAVAG